MYESTTIDPHKDFRRAPPPRYDRGHIGQRDERVKDKGNVPRTFASSFKVPRSSIRRQRKVARTNTPILPKKSRYGPSVPSNESKLHPSRGVNNSPRPAPARINVFLEERAPKIESRHNIPLPFQHRGEQHGVKGWEILESQRLRGWPRHRLSTKEIVKGRSPRQRHHDHGRA